MTDAPAAAAVEPTLGWSIGVVFRAWQQRVSGALDSVPHAGRGYQILETLRAASEPPTQAGLAGHLGIDRTVLTYVLDDLVDAGVVERRTDAADRRVRRLTLTAAGRDCLAALDAQVATAEAELFPGLTRRDRDALGALLRRAATGIHAGSDPEHACTVVRSILEPRSAG
ncbi:MarR family winged helix-turn-helix transcriptional regulator [Galbitalea sp. SE-J8]|uniref:MarR family winged helix-turn-helix transcriptional regulator n=1 Tax=Galbitalea sp. SE-J8 TaxID=3054952 RepID=UPI00259CD7E5|nr:MarR family winged helix-turn-helix transcriptional regulator [Galbitalea sp. SE-J8]MDM4762582.1 MarR family winged helix-turn-helix transcriptional regulator [Galbitalea sp. SE-J8]